MSGFSFGTPQTPQAATNTALPTFGTPQTTASIQPTFGSTPAASTGTGLTGGFSFGGPAKPVTGFGSPMPNPNNPLTLTNNPMQNTNPSLTTSTPAPPSFQLSTPAATTTTNLLGASATPISAVAPITNNQFSFGTPATTTGAPSFNFGQTSSAPTTSVPSLSLATSAVPNAQPSLFGGITASTASVPVQTTQPSTNSFVGLGGIDMSATQQQKVLTEGKVEVAKETLVPSQIVQSIEDFKTYVKNQKTISSEISRSSDRKLKTVTDEIQRMNCVLQEASNNIDNNNSALRHLRNETAKVIENADMAQRTHETPVALQFENVMPQIYFRDLIQKYETDLLNLKQQVELTEKHLQSLANPQIFSAEDLKKGLQQLYESFIALAGRLQEAHSKVETQKTKYLELRKVMLRDTTNVFEEKESTSGNKDAKIQYGPNAFSQDTQLGYLNMSFQKAQQHQTAPGNFSLQSNPSFNFMTKM
ncbi:nuclear pore complex protein Nup58 [Chironomus tepperi]|uniref:nuclear pore complex protein Nup58 n=1 Tax=Chironomus tepperi TaxID=113505 RepID=UPI00391F6169